MENLKKVGLRNGWTGGIRMGERGGGHGRSANEEEIHTADCLPAEALKKKKKKKKKKIE